MAITIIYGTRGSETQEEAAERFWSPSCKYADKLFAEKVKRDRGFSPPPGPFLDPDAKMSVAVTPPPRRISYKKGSSTGPTCVESSCQGCKLMAREGNGLTCPRGQAATMLTSVFELAVNPGGDCNEMS